MIPLCEPSLNGNEWIYIKKCLDSNVVSSVGSYVQLFEKSFSDYLGFNDALQYHAVACVNGTSALHIALLVAGIQPHEEVIMPALTFIAPANAIRYIGAWPVFIDVDPLYWQLDPQKVYDFLNKQCHVRNGALINRNTGRKIVSILPVHILGHPVHMDPIIELAKKFNLTVIEDAAESLGATYKGRLVGTLGDMACFSFNGNKIITSGGGGMVVSKNSLWAKKARYFTTQAKDDPMEYIHHEVGYNYRLSNLQAAVGVAQLERLDEYITAKKDIVERYKKVLKDVPGIRQPLTAEWANSTSWLYTVLIDSNVYGINGRQLQKILNEHNIQSRPLWCPIHQLKPFYKSFSYEVEVAMRLYRDALSLPSSVSLKEEDQARVSQVIVENRKHMG